MECLQGIEATLQAMAARGFVDDARFDSVCIILKWLCAPFSPLSSFDG
jgi:hypothetical protein